ncbi:MAG: DUF3300 domain-containing protein, partial [Actinomycetota bacterium]
MSSPNESHCRRQMTTTISPPSVTALPSITCDRFTPVCAAGSTVMSRSSSLLHQVLVAATYPLEIVQADRWRQSNSRLQG